MKEEALAPGKKPQKDVMKTVLTSYVRVDQKSRQKKSEEPIELNGNMRCKKRKIYTFEMH